MSESEEIRPRNLRDNWWWSGGLWTVGGGAVVWYQSPVIRDGTAIWANWLMAAIGAGLVLVGLYRLWLSWQVESASRAAAQADTGTQPGPSGTEPGPGD